jgi:TM2 domain-containing membrane protein YozV
MRHPGTAAVLSFLIPGVGQLYNGRWGWALFWLIITPGFWIGTGGMLGWICHVISAYQAYLYAKENPYPDYGRR